MMQTPPRPASKNTSLVVDTPYKHSSLKADESISCTQKELQGLMEDELYKGIFECKCGIFVEKLCPVDQSHMKSVISFLKRKKISHDPLGYVSGSSEPNPWPSTSNKRDYYEPFASLLNAVISSNRKSETIHRDLRFYAYDRQMTEGVGIDSPLKPDMIGCHRVTRDQSEPLSWHEVEIFVEVKDSWPSMLTQAAAYARACFVFQPHRRFVPVIHFHHKNMDVRIGFYSRSGLVITESMKLSEAAGFRNFVTTMVGIGSWKKAGDAGIDTSRSHTEISIRQKGTYKILKTLCDRRVTRGRATRVYVLIKEDPKKPAITDQTAASPQRVHQYLLRSHKVALNPSGIKAIRALKEDDGDGALSRKRKISVSQCDGPSSRKGKVSPAQRDGPSSRKGKKDNISSSQRDDSNLIDWQLVIRSVPMNHFIREPEPKTKGGQACPTTVILKDSWPLSSHSDEGSIFMPLNGNFGLPIVLDSYSVAEETKCNVNVIPDEAVYWNVLGTESDGVTAEKRRHMRVVLETQGFGLTTAEGPRALVQGIVHAILGHYVLFDHGWLHQDVSIGNVMLMRGETRTSVKAFDETSELTDCFGFICDGDQAIPWKDQNRELASRHSGTLPFMSQALINAWVIGINVSHTAIDDLESFVWVLFWTILHILDSRKVLVNAQERYYLKTMRSDRLGLLNRESFLKKLKKQRKEKRGGEKGLSAGLEPFYDLLVKWLELSERAEEEVQQYESDVKGLETCARRIYNEYVSIGLKSLEGLEENWDYIGRQG